MIKSRPLIIATSVMMIAMPHVFGQSSLTLVGSVPGFSVPLGFAPAPNYLAVNRISLAPGQIVTLQVTGMKTVLPVGQIIRATTLPLPTTLLGISVTISQVVRGGTNVIEPAPVVKTGSATPTPAPVLDPASRLGSGRTLELQYDFRPNAEPSRPFNVLTGVISPTPPTAPVILLAPVFVGLTPGQVGLYQINVQLPSAFPAAVLPCTTLAVGTGNPAYPPAFVQSNLTIDIGGVSSFDGAPICVQPGQ